MLRRRKHATFSPTKSDSAYAPAKESKKARFDDPDFEDEEVEEDERKKPRRGTPPGIYRGVYRRRGGY